jgi:BirA family transcriptional regulator, biotin operon repressor / biotin---[acetyl-CoA-carboxylase] ligase
MSGVVQGRSGKPVADEAWGGPDALSIEVMRRDLRGETFGTHILLFTSVPSTNAVLRQLAADGAREGTVVMADGQTAGRGRRGQAWFSPPGVNLYLSVLLRPAIAPRAVPLLSFIASLALAETIGLQGVRAGIRWPNDVVVDGQKVAGTLVTAAVREERVDWVVLGVGVNLNVTAAALRAALGPAAEHATSLRETVGHAVDRNAFAATYLNVLDKWLETWRQAGPEAVLAAWRRHDVLAGRRVVIRDEGGEHPRRVLGVNQEGHLVVEDADGVTHEVLGGEIRLAA